MKNLLLLKKSSDGMGDLLEFQIGDRLENSGLISSIVSAINGEIYAGRDGADYVKQSLKSLIKPFGLPLIGVAFLYFGSRWVVGRVMSKVEGWRWYFKWPLKIIAGVGGFIIFLGGVELLTNQDYSEDEDRYQSKKSRKEGLMKMAKRLQPEPSNTVESDGAGGLRRRIDEFKFKKFTDSIPAWGRYETDRNVEFADANRHPSPSYQQERMHLRRPYVIYNRRKPHWQKKWMRGDTSPYLQSRNLER
jgi:hypothetical protein